MGMPTDHTFPYLCCSLQLTGAGVTDHHSCMQRFVKLSFVVPAATLQYREVACSLAKQLHTFTFLLCWFVFYHLALDECGCLPECEIDYTHLTCLCRWSRQEPTP